MAIKYDDQNSLSNLIFIDEHWLAVRGMTLYHLVGCSDILVSDVSSIIIDFLLVDKPIVCISEDLDTYKKTRGFYFDDIESWIPTKILKNQNELFEHLNALLQDNEDPFQSKRESLKNTFFVNHDYSSTKKLVDYVMSL